MKRQWLLAIVLLGAACSNGFWSCGRGGDRCCTNAVMKRDVVYRGTIAAADGGMPTRVELTLDRDERSRVTFIRDGIEITQAFSTQSR